jgi:membrane-associated phospholipid phosphatase
VLREGTEGEGALPSQSRALSSPAAPGLRSPGVLGRWPLIGLLLVLLGLGAFAFFAFNVQANGPLVHNDVVVENTLHQDALASPSWLRDIMISGYYFGQHVIVAIGIVLAVYFIYRRFWPELLMVLIAWAGEGSLWLVLSGYFHRTRPVFAVPVWHQMTAPSFPSGHTLSAVMCYGLLAYLIVPKIRSGWGKAAVIALAALLVAFIGFSRVFIGDHYLTDVLAGLALGFAWAGLVYTVVELVARSRRKQERGRGEALRDA